MHSSSSSDTSTAPTSRAVPVSLSVLSLSTFPVRAGAVLPRLGHQLRGVSVAEVPPLAGRLGAPAALLLAVLGGHAAVQVVARDDVAATAKGPLP